LETKHAAYYLDKIKDLPVFLVVVDVNKNKGWYHFLQPGLEKDQSWRKQKSVTIYLPASNDLTDTLKLRQAIEGAKRMMRLLHPESVQDAVEAHKSRVRAIDPRFDVKVSLINDMPMFEFRALQPVSGQIEFKGNKSKVEAKVSDLIDKGALVAFKPGEVKITGSPLFERLEREGGAIQCAVQLAGTLSLTCKDGEGRELGRLSEMPGQLTGGRSELWFDGGLAESPLSVKLGPMAAKMGGSVEVNWKWDNWGGQTLLQLAFFDRLVKFFEALVASAATEVECQLRGTRFFFVSVPLNKGESVKMLAAYLDLLDKARKIAKRFAIDPIWTRHAFDAAALETAKELHTIFFEGGLVTKMPNVVINLQCHKETFRPDVLKRLEGNHPFYLSSTWGCNLLGQETEIGQLTQEFTAVKVAMKKVRKTKRKRTRSNKYVNLVVTGSKETVRTIRPGDLLAVQD
jgi:hypothetical protein